MSGFEGDTSSLIGSGPDLTRSAGFASASDTHSNSIFKSEKSLIHGKKVSGIQKNVHAYQEMSRSEIDMNMQETDLIRSSVTPSIPSYSSNLTGETHAFSSGAMPGSMQGSTDLMKPVGIEPVSGSIDMSSPYMNEASDLMTKAPDVPLTPMPIGKTENKPVKKEDRVDTKTQTVVKYVEKESEAKMEDLKEEHTASSAQPNLQAQAVKKVIDEEEEEDEELRPEALEKGEEVIILRPTEAVNEEEKRSWIRPKSQKEKLASKLQRLTDAELFIIAERAFDDASNAKTSDELMVANAKKSLLSIEVERRRELNELST